MDEEKIQLDPMDKMVIKTILKLEQENSRCAKPLKDSEMVEKIIHIVKRSLEEKNEI